MVYVDREYKGSEAYYTVMSITDRGSLLFRRGYTEGAIRFHKEQGNAGQVKFFEDELKLINKRLKLKAMAN